MSEQKEKLHEELQTYETHLEEWAEDQEKFVLIHGSEIVGLFSTYEDALNEGYGRFGLVPFLVKQISQKRQAHFVSRLFAPNIA